MSTVIIIYPHVSWEITSRRLLYQALAKQLTGKALVLIVNRPIWPPFELYRDTRKLFRWLVRAKKPYKIGEKLFLFDPWILFQDQIILGLNWLVKLNKYFLRQQIRNALCSLGVEFFNRIAWIAHPLQYDWLGLADEYLQIYECFDEYAAYPGFTNKYRKKVLRYEDKVLKKVNIVFTVSHELLRKKTQKNVRTFCIPNAVDFEHFKKASSDEISIPDEITNVRHPIVGFIGGIWGIIDMRLMKYIATSNDAWSILLIGNLSFIGTRSFFAEFRKFTDLSNVHWLGWKDYENLPNYLKAMDVCLLPYVLNEWTRSCYPSKVHQYLSAGKPVVSTDLPEIRPFSNVVNIAKTHKEFLEKISESLSENNPPLVSKRISLAIENTWNKRAEQIIEIINDKVG